MVTIDEFFMARVEERTGHKFEDIPVGDISELIGSHIMLANSDWYIVGIGYADENDVYSSFKRIPRNLPQMAFSHQKG